MATFKLAEFKIGANGNSFDSDIGNVSNGSVYDATVWYDADSNGIFDLGEPYTATDIEGNYVLNIPDSFDTSTGIIRSQGGTDISTGLPVLTTFSSLPDEHENITPLTTLIHYLVEDGLTPQEAHDLVVETFDIHQDVDLGDFDHTEQAYADNPHAEKVLLAITSIHNIVVQMHHFLTGSAAINFEDSAVSSAFSKGIYTAIAKALQNEEFNLEDVALLEGIISDAATVAEAEALELGLKLNIDEEIINNTANGVAQILAASTTKVHLLSDESETGQELVANITKVKHIAHDNQASDLHLVGRGELAVAKAVAKHAQTDEETLNEIQEIVLPPQKSHIDDFMILEDETVTDYQFTVFDRDTSLDLLNITAVSDNPELLPEENIVITPGEDSNTRILSLTPKANQFGFAEVNLTIENEAGKQLSQEFIFDVLSVNDAPEYVGSALLGVVQGDSVTITAEELLTKDADNSAEELEYKLAQLPTQGNLLLKDTVLTTDAVFTQADINSGKPIYFHNADNTTADSFEFIVQDLEETKTSTITANIAIAENSMFGSPMNDVLDGTVQSDVIKGNDGNDVLNGYSGNDIMFGQDGDDTLIGGEGFERLSGGAGNDLLDAGSRISVLTGGLGQDTFVINGQAVDWIKDFEVGQDQISLSNGIDYGSLEITGEINSFVSYQNTQIAVLLDVNPEELIADSFISNNAPEYKGSSLFGAVQGESTTITATELLTQDADNTPAELEYRLTQLPTGGELLKDDIVLEDDSIFTQADINSGRLAYNYFGDKTADSFEFVVKDLEGEQTPTITTKIAIAQNSVTGSLLDDVLRGTVQSDLIKGKDGNDSSNGDDGNDLMFGQDGDDTLTGGEGFDRLNGGVGNDLLDGGLGINVLTGGSGQDTFIVDGQAVDWIKDFEVGQD